MIEATCTACGTVNRVADVPAGTKFVTCASCKSRVALTARPALDLADLPAPRRQSPLGPDAAKTTPRAPLPSTEPELPAPRTKKPIASAAPSNPVDLDQLLAPPDAGTDLPTPVGPAANLPAPRGMSEQQQQRPVVGRAMTDLPVPGVADTLADLPAPKAKNAPITDLPAPRSKVPAMPPMPKPKIATPPPVKAAGLGDLPAPKARGAGAADLPAPKARGGDMPAPKGGSALADLAPPGIVDLPTPKPGMSDLPMPKPGQAGDLPAPKGFFDDLPQPARTQPQSTEVAPKGFFDDLPQPARTQPQSTEVAPKGFFDDLPGRPNQQKPEVPAPKGFFDDLPGRTNQQKPEVPAPKGFFDDLPKPSASIGGVQPIDLGALGGAPGDTDLDMGGFELAEEPPPTASPVNLRGKAPSVAPAPGPSNQFDDLDLSAPSPVSFQKGRAAASGLPGAANSHVATISPQAAAAAAAVAPPHAAPPPVKPKSDALELEVDEPRRKKAPSVAPTPQLSPKQVREGKKAAAAATRHAQGRARKIIGIVVLGLIALGGAGFYLYQRHAKAQEHENAVNEQLGAARSALGASQWQRAALAAQKTLELDKKNGEALGIRAEALFALGISEGGNSPRFAQARKVLADALEAGAQTPALERAQALSPISAGQGEKAIPKLKALAAKAPKDGSLQLYLGWAYGVHGEYDEAIKAFDAATASAAVKLHALFARARIKLLKGDLEGARTDYAAVLDIQKDHIGAQVGLAAALPAEKAQQREADLLAILALKDVEKKEPRAAMQAWILAADVARKSGRLDVARERFRKALAIQASDIEALTGLAEVELQDGKVDLAAETAGKALTQNPDDMRAQLVATEIAIVQKHPDDASKRLGVLEKRTPPPPVVDQARMKLLRARLLEAQGKEQDAIDAYLEAAKLAGDLDLTPTLIAAKKLYELAGKAEAANDAARAEELRKKADELLAALSDNADKDPQLMLTLGMAYLQAGDAEKAESWLRRFTEKRPKDVDGQYQLAIALTKLGRSEEAINRLRIAVDLDPTRSEIGLELARTYEDTHRDTDAEKLYDKLLAAKEPPLVLRARAGRFFAKIGQMAKAGEQGVKILAVQDDHPAGLYLKGEGLLKEGKTDAARKLFVQASDGDQSEPQYQDARGRAAEQWAKESGNTTYQDDALRSYGRAVEKDASYFTSWLGQGRLYVVRNENEKAIVPLQTAWKLKQTAEVARLLGIAAKQLNRAGEAEPWLVQSLKMEDNAEAAYALGQVYVDASVNKPKQAIDALELAVRLGLEQEKKTGQPVPWLTDALYMLGDINRTQNNLKQAKTAWEKWLARNPKPGAKVNEVKNLMATTLKDL